MYQHKCVHVCAKVCVRARECVWGCLRARPNHSISNGAAQHRLFALSYSNSISYDLLRALDEVWRGLGWPARPLFCRETTWEPIEGPFNLCWTLGLRLHTQSMTDKLCLWFIMKVVSVIRDSRPNAQASWWFYTAWEEQNLDITEHHLLLYNTKRRQSESYLHKCKCSE